MSVEADPVLTYRYVAGVFRWYFWGVGLDYALEWSLETAQSESMICVSRRLRRKEEETEKGPERSAGDSSQERTSEPRCFGVPGPAVELGYTLCLAPPLGRFEACRRVDKER